MAYYSDNTTLGGNGGFLTIQWSRIQAIHTQDDDKKRLVLEFLIARYWKPVYCYLRREGLSNDQAKDLTQGFFCDIVMTETLIKRADPAKGRFRSFLLTALKCYLIDQHRKQTSGRRSPKGVLVPLEADSVPELPSTLSHLDPERIFHYVWATELLDQALTQVRALCESTGKSLHWLLFQDKILSPIMNNQPAPSWAQLCERYDVPDEQAASNRIVTVKRCFRRVLDDLLSKHCQNNSDTEDEFRDLLQHIGAFGAG